MHKTRDVWAKLWARRNTNSALARDLFGGGIAETLPIEQPLIFNLQVDILVRNVLREIHHVECQSTNEAGFAFRMLRYYVYLRDLYLEPIHQSVFYIGTEPCRIQKVFQELGTRHEIRIVNLQDYKAEDLLASPEWSDNLWALGARGDKPMVLHEIVERLRKLDGDEQKDALAALAAYSGILDLDKLLNQELKEFSMVTINLEDNAVVRPLIEKAERKGREEGRSEGREEGRSEGREEGRSEGRSAGLVEGRRQQLLSLLAEKFGRMPAAVDKRISHATLEQLDRWARQLIKANSIEDTLK